MYMQRGTITVCSKPTIDYFYVSHYRTLDKNSGEHYKDKVSVPDVVRPYAIPAPPPPNLTCIARRLGQLLQTVRRHQGGRTRVASSSM